MQKESNQNDKPLGQILVEKNIISQEQLDSALKEQQTQKEAYLGNILLGMGVSQSKINKVLDQFNKRKPLGQVLIDLKLLTPQQLDEVLAKQKKLKKEMKRKPLGVLLVEMGYTTYDAYMDALSKHFNMPIVLLKNFTPHPSLQKAVGEKYAQKNKIIVLANDEIKIKVGLAEPTQSLIEELLRIFTGMKNVEFHLAYPVEVEACFKKLAAPFGVNLIR